MLAQVSKFRSALVLKACEWLARDPPHGRYQIDSVRHLILPTAPLTGRCDMSAPSGENNASPPICDSYPKFGAAAPRQTGVITRRKKWGRLTPPPPQQMPG